MNHAWRQQLGDPTCPYMERWVLDLGRFGSIRLHHWRRSDDKRHKHDHPADFITLVLKGSYVDLADGVGKHPMLLGNCGACRGMPTSVCDLCGKNLKSERLRPGDVRRRQAEHRHTVSVQPGGCWTLLYFFPDRRDWGFWVPRKLDGKLKFKKTNKYFLEHGHHPCDQP